MLTRPIPALFLAGLLAFGSGGPAAAQANKDEKTPAPKKKDAVTPTEVSFATADGVRLAGKFYAGKVGGPVVLMLHDYKANPDEVAWEDTAQLCVKLGFNVVRFDFRGHGKSTEVVPGDFWLRPENRAGILGGTSRNVAAKTTIKFAEFRPSYFPMLVQDIAAARNYIDQQNDNGVVNASTIYLLGAGEAADLGFLFMASEWSRERQKPNVAVPPQYVSLARPLFPAAESAGQDIGGAIWLGPNNSRAVPTSLIRKWCQQPATIELRNQTRMLFVSGDKNRPSNQYSKFLFGDALLLDRTTGPGGVRLVKPDKVSFLREIKGSKGVGAELLGNNLGTEKMITDFLTEIDKDRGTRTSKPRQWDKPLWIDLNSYGLVP